MFKVEKKRPEYQTRNFVIPISRIELPQEFWDEARRMKNSWNEITAEFKRFDAPITELEEQINLHRQSKTECGDLKDARKELLKQRSEAVRAKWKIQTEVLYNNDLETLQMGVEKSLKARSMRFKHGIESVNFSKRYGSGGIPFGNLFTVADSRSETLRRKPFAVRQGVKRTTDGRTNTGRKARLKTPLHGSMLVGKSRVRVNFTGLWSYPHFLEQGFVKKVSLTGTYSTLFRKWQWSIIVAAELPPEQIARDTTLPVAGLDVGYRVFPDFIRFGFITDSFGNSYELRLPHGNMATNYLRNTVKFVEGKGGKKEFVRDLYDFFDWDSAQGKFLEETKSNIKTVREAAQLDGTELPAELLSCLQGIVKMRNRGLLKIKKIAADALAGNGLDAAAGKRLDELVKIIEKWEQGDQFYETEKYHYRRKFLGRRELLYRQVTKFLSENYAQVFYEEDLKLAQISRKAKKSSRVTDAALVESNKFRQWTGLYKFRQFLAERAQKMDGDWLVPATTAYSTYFCDECGAETVSDPVKLIAVCGNGHERDQDDKASRNFIKEAGVRIIPGKPISVPEHLKNFIIPIND